MWLLLLAIELLTRLTVCIIQQTVTKCYMPRPLWRSLFALALPSVNAGAATDYTYGKKDAPRCTPKRSSLTTYSAHGFTVRANKI